jgi:hypothetical protein
MANSRRTNLALLAVVVLSFVTGSATYLVGAAPGTTLITVAHAAVGLAVLLLVPWKSVVVRRGLRRPPHPGRQAGLLLGGLLGIAVVAGVVQEVVGYGTVVGVSPLQVHVGAALGVLAALAAHTYTHPQRLRPTDLSRRTALRTGLLGVGALGIAQLSRWITPFQPAQRTTGSTEQGSNQASAMPITQWLSDEVPASVQLQRPLVVDGRPVELPGAPDEMDAVLDCTGGWFATQRWAGVRLDRLLGPVSRQVRSVDVISVTGYRRRFPIADAPHLLLATSVSGEPLSAGHGAPRRLVAPGRRGFWWVKWVVAVETTSEPPWLQSPFPLQ